MALTKDFKSTIRARAQRDTNYRRALLLEAVNALLNHEMDIAKLLLRDYINATIAFEPLAKQMDKNSKSLQRMLSSSGNPTANSLFSIIHILQEVEGIKLTASLSPATLK